MSNEQPTFRVNGDNIERWNQQLQAYVKMPKEELVEMFNQGGQAVDLVMGLKGIMQMLGFTTMPDVMMLVQKVITSKEGRNEGHTDSETTEQAKA